MSTIRFDGRLDLDGFHISGSNQHFSFDPKATCSLFEELGLIEGWDLDANGEPIILITGAKVIFDEMEIPTTDFSFWHSFVTSFCLTQREMDIIGYHLSEKARFNRILQKSGLLLEQLRFLS